MRGAARVQRAAVEITFVGGGGAPAVGSQCRLVEPDKVPIYYIYIVDIVDILWSLTRTSILWRCSCYVIEMLAEKWSWMWVLIFYVNAGDMIGHRRWNYNFLNLKMALKSHLCAPPAHSTV